MNSEFALEEEKVNTRFCNCWKSHGEIYYALTYLSDYHVVFDWSYLPSSWLNVGNLITTVFVHQSHHVMKS